MQPDKTYVGRIKKGFDFLWGHFDETPKISKTSEENHRTRHALRYARNESSSSIGRYRERWTSWCNGLLKCCNNGSKNSHGVMVVPVTNSSGSSRRRSMKKTSIACATILLGSILSLQCQAWCPAGTQQGCISMSTSTYGGDYIPARACCAAYGCANGATEFTWACPGAGYLPYVR